MHFCELYIPTSSALAGDKSLSRKLPENLRAIFAAETRDRVDDLTRRVIGKQISERGSFTFSFSDPCTWLNTSSANDPVSVQQAEQVLWAVPRLGSIKLSGFALLYSDRDFIGFWVETEEGEKKRVLASSLLDGQFEALPSGFAFTTGWIVSEIIRQY